MVKKQQQQKKNSHTCLKISHAPDLQNILQKPVVWECHVMFPFLQGISSLTPFPAAAPHLSHTPEL